MSRAWVIGSGGLLGSSLVRVLRGEGRTPFEPAQRFAWLDSARLHGQIVAAVEEFAGVVIGGRRWEIYWAAGIGTMGCSEADLAPEMAALDTLLDCIAANPVLGSIPGTFSFASSAGAIYAGSPDEVITEHSQTSPTSPYARCKLQQEARIRDFAERRCPGTAALLARISTLYGPAQAWAKAQGLITQVARQVVRNQPVNIFVPLDTIRDYIAVDDAAAEWVGAARAMADWQGAIVKIIASGQPTTIAEIVSIIRRLSRRRLPIVTAANRRSAAYSRCIRFRSSVLPVTGLPSPTSLPVGVARVLAAERARHAAGN